MQVVDPAELDGITALDEIAMEELERGALEDNGALELTAMLLEERGALDETGALELTAKLLEDVPPAYPFQAGFAARSLLRTYLPDKLIWDSFQPPFGPAPGASAALVSVMLWIDQLHQLRFLEFAQESHSSLWLVKTPPLPSAVDVPHSEMKMASPAFIAYSPAERRSAPWLPA